MKQIRAYLILFGGVLALSTSAIWVRLANAPSAVTAFYRLFLTALMLLPFLLCSPKHRSELLHIHGKEWARIFSAGFFLALHYLLWFESLHYTSIASSTVIVCLQPLFSMALERFVLKTRIRSTALLGCFVSLVGCAVIGFGDFQISGQSLLGDILAFLAAGVISLYYFIGQNVRQRVSAVTYSVLSYSTSAAVLLLFVGLRGMALTGYAPNTYWVFLGLALVATVGGQFVFNLLLKQLPASAVTMSILGEPIGTCILAGIFLQERMTRQQLLGITVIIGGLVLYFFLPARRNAPCAK